MIARTSLVVILAFAAFGCSRSSPLQRGERAGTVTSLAQIAGRWDIAQFGSYKPARLGQSGLRQAYVDVRPNGLSYSIGCNVSGNPAHIDPSGTLHDDESNGSHLSTMMGCPEGDKEGAFYRFFGAKPKVSLAGGRLRMSAGKTELLLERPEVRRVANIPTLKEITGRWVPQMATHIVDTGGYEGWGFQQAGVLSIAGNRLAYSGCGGASVAFSFTKDARIATSDYKGADYCADDTAGTTFLRLMRQNPFVERTDGPGIALTANDKVISLESEEELRRARENPESPPVGVSPPRPPEPPHGH